MDTVAHFLSTYSRLADAARASRLDVAPVTDSCVLNHARVELRYDPAVEVDRAFVTVDVGAVAPECELAALLTFMGTNFVLYADPYQPVYSRRPGTHEYVLKYACAPAVLSRDDFEAQLRNVVQLAEQWRITSWPVFASDDITEE